MTKPSESSESRLHEAELLLADLLARQGAGEHVALDEVIAMRQDLEAELRQMWSQIEAVDRALEDDARETARARTQVEDVLRELAASRSFGERYSIEGEIGRGGMGAVLRVVDKKLDRPLALKLIVGQASSARTGKTPPLEARQLVRFLNEARITSQLDHPGIVPVHEVGADEEGRAYFTMKLVQGVTLAEVFARCAAGDRQWRTPRVLGTLQRVCEAVAFAHGRGVIHRDLKPQNVMVGDFGEVYVMDWGLARRLREEDSGASEAIAEQLDEQLAEQTTRTGEGHVLGTPAFMSPEQARGEIERMGPQSDVYALGAMLYQLVAGHAPYMRPGEKASGSEILARVVTGPPLRLESRDAPPEVIAICEKAMSYAQKYRYASMRELAEDLERFLQGHVVLAFRTGPLERTRKWIKRNKALSGTFGSAGLAVLTLALLLYIQNETRAAELEFTEAFRRGEAVLSTDWSGSGPEQVGKRLAARQLFERCTNLRRDDASSWLRLAEVQLRLEQGVSARATLERAETLGASGFYAKRLRNWLEKGRDNPSKSEIPAELSSNTSTWEPIDRIDYAFVLYATRRYREAYELLADIEQSQSVVMGRMLRAQIMHVDGVSDTGNQILQDPASEVRIGLGAYDETLRAIPGEPAVEYNRFILLFDALNRELDTGFSDKDLIADLDRYAEKRRLEPQSLEVSQVLLKVCWAHVSNRIEREVYLQRGIEVAHAMSADDIGRLEDPSFGFLMQILVIAGDYEHALERSKLRLFDPGPGYPDFKPIGPLHLVLMLHRDLTNWSLLEPVPGRVERFLETVGDQADAADFDAAAAVLETMPGSG